MSRNWEKEMMELEAEKVADALEPLDTKLHVWTMLFRLATENKRPQTEDQIISEMKRLGEIIAPCFQPAKVTPKILNTSFEEQYQLHNRRVCAAHKAQYGDETPNVVGGSFWENSGDTLIKRFSHGTYTVVFEENSDKITKIHFDQNPVLPKALQETLVTTCDGIPSGRIVQQNIPSVTNDD